MKSFVQLVTVALAAFSYVSANAIPEPVAEAVAEANYGGYNDYHYKTKTVKVYVPKTIKEYCTVTKTETKWKYQKPKTIYKYKTETCTKYLYKYKTKTVKIAIPTTIKEYCTITKYSTKTCTETKKYTETKTCTETKKIYVPPVTKTCTVTSTVTKAPVTVKETCTVTKKETCTVTETKKIKYCPPTPKPHYGGYN